MARVQTTKSGAVVTITLSRPEIHNAFDPEMIQGLTDAFRQLAADPAVARHSGRVLDVGDVARLYGVTDLDGSQPQWHAEHRERPQDA